MPSCWLLLGTRVFQVVQVVNLNRLRMNMSQIFLFPFLSMSLISLHLSLEDIPPKFNLFKHSPMASFSSDGNYFADKFLGTPEM